MQNVEVNITSQEIEEFGIKVGRKLETQNSTKQLRVTHDLIVMHRNSTQIKTCFQSYIPSMLENPYKIKRFMTKLDKEADELFAETKITSLSLTVQPSLSPTDSMMLSPMKLLKDKAKRKGKTKEL